ncbi:MAG: MFS transporter [Erysipelotrichales bacterium]|nr:MFS transporter [Erysipelotrichales bacterium]
MENIKTQSQVKAFNRHMTARLRVFYFVKYVTACFFGSLFAIYLAEYQGLDNIQIGFMMSIVSLTAIGARPTWAIIADKTNKPLLLVRIAYFVVLGLGIFFLFRIEFYLLLIIYIIFDLFYGVIMPLTDSVTIKYINNHPEEVSDFGKINFLGVIAWLSTSLFLGFMADRFGIIVSIWFFLPMTVIAFFCVGLLPKEASPKNTNYRRDMKFLFRNRRYVLFLIFYFFFMLAYAGSIFYNFNYMHQTFDVSMTYLTLMAVSCNIIEIPIMIFSAVIFRKIGYRKIFMLSLTALFLFNMIFVLATHQYWFILAFMLRGVTNGLYLPIFYQYIASITEERIKITAVMIFTSIMSLGIFVSANLFGLFVGNFGFQQAYIVQLCLTIIPFILLFMFKIKNPPEEIRECNI